MLCYTSKSGGRKIQAVAACGKREVGSQRLQAVAVDAAGRQVAVSEAGSEKSRSLADVWLQMLAEATACAWTCTSTEVLQQKKV